MDAFLQKHAEFDHEENAMEFSSAATNDAAPKISFPWATKKSNSADKDRQKTSKRRKKSKSVINERDNEAEIDNDSLSSKKRKKKRKKSKRGVDDERKVTNANDDASSSKKKRKSRKSSKSKSSKTRKSSAIDPSLFADVDFTGMDAFSLGEDPYKQSNQMHKEKQKQEQSANWLSRVRIRPTARRDVQDEFEEEMAKDIRGGAASKTVPAKSSTEFHPSSDVLLRSKATIDRASRSKQEREADRVRVTEPINTMPERKTLKMQSLEDFLDDSNSDIQSVASNSKDNRVTDLPSTSHTLRKESPPSDKSSPRSSIHISSDQLLVKRSSSDTVSEKSHDSDRMNVNLASYLDESVKSTRSSGKSEDNEAKPFHFIENNSDDDIAPPKQSSSSIRVTTVADTIPTRFTRKSMSPIDDAVSFQSAELDPFRFANYDEDQLDLSNVDDTDIQDDIMSQLTSDSVVKQSKAYVTLSETKRQSTLTSPGSDDDKSIESGGAMFMMADDLSSVDDSSQFNMLSTSELIHDATRSESRSSPQKPQQTTHEGDIPTPRSEASSVPSFPSFRSHESQQQMAIVQPKHQPNTKQVPQRVPPKEHKKSVTQSMEEDSFDQMNLSLDEFDVPDLPDNFEDEFEMDMQEFDLDGDLHRELRAEIETFESPVHRAMTAPESQHISAVQQQKTTVTASAAPAPQQKPAVPKATMETQTPYHSAQHSYMPTPNAGFIPATGAYLSQILGNDYIQRKAGLQSTLLAQNEMFKHQLDVIRMNLVQTQMQMLQITGVTPSHRTVKEAWGEASSGARRTQGYTLSQQQTESAEQASKNNVSSQQDKENVSPTMEEQIFEQLRKQQETINQSKKSHRYTTLEDTRAYLRLRNNFVS